MEVASGANAKFRVTYIHEVEKKELLRQKSSKRDATTNIIKIMEQPAKPNEQLPLGAVGFGTGSVERISAHNPAGDDEDEPPAPRSRAPAGVA